MLKSKFKLHGHRWRQACINYGEDRLNVEFTLHYNIIRDGYVIIGSVRFDRDLY